MEDARPGRDAPPGSGRPTGTARGERRRGRRFDGKPKSEQPRSYYGLPVLNKPVWEAREIAGYFFLGGLAGASSVVAAGAQLTGRGSLARAAKVSAAGAAGLSLAALVKDLGRPRRFLNMLRVFKPTSPMSVGTWLLSGYAPAALAAAASDLTGIAPGLGVAATAGAAMLGPAIASYTGVLIADTAVPAWHDARRELPPLFVASAATAAAGVGLVATSGRDAVPAQRLALLGVAGELGAGQMLERRLEAEVVRAYREGRAQKLMRLAQLLSVAGAA
ncbi:MAG: polysulfide reductase NrfD, partial [Acidimicrobiaceae bacterium]|nr:polysulfide reductase NrfD [Acidimicrobiaceae bacterium]